MKLKEIMTVLQSTSIITKSQKIMRISHTWILSVSKVNKTEKERWLRLIQKSQMTIHNQRTRDFTKTLQYESLALPLTLKQYEEESYILIAKNTEECSRGCIEWVMSACFLTDCACSLCPDMNLYHTQMSLRTELLRSQLTGSPFPCLLFMEKTMLNHYKPNLVTTSLGSGKTQVNSVPVRCGSLNIRRLYLSWMLTGKLDGRRGC